MEFSVLTPTYNCAGYIRRAYWSLCKQTVQDWEWVVVDDGSTDDTQSVLSSLGDHRVRVVRNHRNCGRGASRNRGLDEAKGDWLVLLDMDDMSFPDRLALARQARAGGHEFMCSAALLLGEDFRVTGVRGFRATSYPRAFVHASLCVDLELARRIGYPDHRIGEDYSMMVTLANAHRGAFVSEPLYLYFEDREMSPQKAFATHASRVEQIELLVRRGLLERNRAVRRTALTSRAKQAGALLLLPFPGLYRRSLRWRSAERSFVLSDERAEFLRRARERPWEQDSSTWTHGTAKE